MPEVRTTVSSARQPFTVAGVARFSQAAIGRVLLWAVILGLLAGFAVSWVADRCWAPVIDEAVAALPPDSAIQGGALRWPERTGRLLSANSFLSIAVVLNDSEPNRAPVDLAFEIGGRDLTVRSIFGSSSAPFPARAAYPFNRTSLVPTWGAWRGPVIFSLVPITMLVLLATWSLLAVPYGIVARTIGATFGRDINFREAWKLSVAAQLFGCVLMTFALTLYGGGQVSLLFVLIILVAHFIPTVCFLLIGPIFVPKKAKRGGATKANPFDEEAKHKIRGKNPFSDSDE